MTPRRTPKSASRKQRTRVESVTDLRRRASGSRRERSSFLILCEGRTEKGYFSGMRSRNGPQIDVDEPGGDHLSIVRSAAKRISDEYDAVWCVLDTELDSGLAKAIIEEAARHDVQVALSVPCFELWLILHKRKWSKPFQSAEAAKRELKKIFPTWREGATAFSDFEAGLDNACSRARELDPTGQDYDKNPSSAAWRVVEAIRGNR